MLLVFQKPLWASVMSKEDSRKPTRLFLIILSIVLQTQLVNAIGWQLFGSLGYFPGLAIGMIMASFQEGETFQFPIYC